MKLKHIAFILVGFFLFSLSGCLTCERKEYKFELKGKNAGRLTINYINIMSKKDKEEMTAYEEANADFTELMDKYINGDEVEKDYPEAKLVKKELYEENGQLCGRVILEFSDLSQIKLYRHEGKGPYMFYTSLLSSETFKESNGTKGPDYMPVIFWPEGSKNLNYSTSVEGPSEKTTSLLSNWKDNRGR